MARIIVSSFLFLCLASAHAAQSLHDKIHKLFVVHEIVGDPETPGIIYAATSNMGVLKSSDAGKSWRILNNGLHNYTTHDVVINPLHSNIVYAGGWTGGVVKSVDKGEHWTDINDGLGNTAIEDIALDPINPDIIYVATTSGVFKSLDAGKHWQPYSKQLPVNEINIFQSLLVISNGPVELLLGADQGLYKKLHGRQGWEKVKGLPDDIAITTLASQPGSNLVLAGTINYGLWQGNSNGDQWKQMDNILSGENISSISFVPNHPEEVYAGLRGKGIFISKNSGANWQAVVHELGSVDVRSLAVNRHDASTLYVGTSDSILEVSHVDNNWINLDNYPVLSFHGIVASVEEHLGSRHSNTVTIPPEFGKCNRCHGWMDKQLNTKYTYWRVPANKRDWVETVERMSDRAKLSEKEKSTIIDFLTRYTQD